MSTKLAVTYSAAVSLRAEDFGCYLESQGANEPPTARRDDGSPLLGFERCVFELQNAETSVVTAKSERPLPYGGTVRLVCPTTQLCAVVVKTESGSRSRAGYKVVMRSPEIAVPSNSHFRILSKYKQRSEMDHVVQSDNIVLLLENSDLFINVLEGSGGALEVVAAFEPCSWTLSRFDRGYTFGEKSSIAHAGRVIAFEHRTYGALLTCGTPVNPRDYKRRLLRRSLWQTGEMETEDTTAQKQDTRHYAVENTTDVYFKASHEEEQDTPVLEQFVCSCDALWIVENADPSIGGPLQVGEQYRVRHVSSGRYLVIKETLPGKYLATTTTTSQSDRAVDMTLFDMDASAEDDRGHISSYHSYVRLRHSTTGMWIGASEMSEFAVVPAAVNSRVNTRDRIVLRHPSAETEQRLFFVMSHSSFLTQYIHRVCELRDLPISPERVFNDTEMKKLLERVSETVMSLLQFCCDDGHSELDPSGVLGGFDDIDCQPNTMNQVMMRELNLIELIIEVMCAPFHNTSDQKIPSPPLLGGIIPLAEVHERQHMIIRNITRMCFRLLTQVVKGSPENATVALKHTDLFLYLEQFDLGIADTMEALLENAQCLSDESVEEVVEKFASLNAHRPTASYIASLAQLCSNGTAGRPVAQRSVLKLLESDTAVLPAQSIELGRLIITPLKNQSSRSHTKRSDSDGALAVELFFSHGDQEFVEYLGACAELLLALCFGAIPECLNFVSTYLSRDHLLMMMQTSFRDAKNLNLAEGVKATYVMLAIQLYLVRDIDLSSQPRLLVVSQNAVPSTMRGSAITGDGAFVRQMKLVAFDLLKNNTALVGDRPGKNRLLTNCASIWLMFVKARMITSSELQELIPILINTLDGRSDLRTQSMLVDEVATAWKNRHDRSDISVIRCKIQLCLVLQSFLHVVAEDAVSAVSTSLGCSDATAESCHSEAMSTVKTSLSLFDVDNVINILLDLVLYHSQELVRRAVGLLTQLITLQQTVAADVAALHVLGSGQSEGYTRVVELIGVLKTNKKGSNCPDEIVLALQELTEQLKTILAAEMTEGDEASHSQGDVLEYLELLRSWEVDKLALNMLPAPTEHTQYSICVGFLSVFCNDAKNAEQLGPQWPRFFEAMEVNPDLIDDVLPLLTQLLPKGNMTCPFSHQDVRTIVRIFVKESNATALQVLRAVLGDGAPRPYQQRDIATVLREEKIFTENWWLNFKPATVISLTELMSICGQGNNYVRRLFQSVFPSAVVVRLLQSSTLSSIKFKSVLLQFLTAIHLVEADDAETQAKKHLRQAQWVQDEVWWRVVRDDFLVRIDELLTSSFSNDNLRVYTIECALTLEAFFKNMFLMSAAVKYEWIMKEVRSCATAMCHLTTMIPNLVTLLPTEKYLMLMLARTTASALGTMNEQTISRLKGLVEKCVWEGDGTAKAGSMTTAVIASTLRQRKRSAGEDEPSSERVLLSETKALFAVATSEEQVEQALGPLVALLRPDNFSDQSLPQRKVIQKLLRCCLHQELKPAGIVTILKALTLLVQSADDGVPSTSTKPSNLMRMQHMINSLAGMKTATVLLDAVDPQIVLNGLRFGISLLEGGNSLVQNDFLEYLGNTDEKLFVGVKRSLEKGALELQHHRKLMISAPTSRRHQPWKLESSDNSFFYLHSLLRLVQLLCEGHNLGLQDYIREQKDNLRSVNTVQICMQFLSALLAGTFADMESLLIQCFQLLTEFCQGPCPGNQAQLVSCNICGIVDTLLRNLSASIDVKDASVTCLLSVVEGCTDSHIAEVVLRQVPLSTLESVFLHKADNEAEANLSLSVGIFLRDMADLIQGTQYYYEIMRLLKQRPDIAGQTGRIEIMRNNAIELVYFRIPPTASQIREDSKFRLLWAVDRSSQSSKLASFYELSDELMMELELVEKFLEKVKEVTETYVPERAQWMAERMMNPSITYWIISSVLLASVINGLLILGLRTNAAIFLPLGFAQLFVSVVSFLIDWEVEAKVFFHKYMKALRHRRAVDKVEYKENVVMSKLTWSREIYIKAMRSRSIACITMILGSVFGVLLSPYFFSFHLFWVVTLSPSLGNVVAAITQNKKTLSLTIMLGMMVCYAFSIIGYALFPEDFDMDDDETSHDNCNSLSHCFFYIVGTGLRQGGGVGDVMKTHNFSSNNFISRRVYDFLFFAIMIVVFLNILFGIIIDTFAELRDAKHRKEEDMRLKCFVCGIESHIFDRLGDGFEHHVKHEHNMWQYFYFMHHLRLKDPNDYTGQESYIAKLLEIKDFSFFPSRCISLEGKLQGIDPTTAGGDSSADAGASQALSAVLGSGNWGNQTGKSTEVREGFDELKTMMRRLFHTKRMSSQQLSPQASFAVGNGGGHVSPGSFATPSRYRGEGRSLGCQTDFGESVAEINSDRSKLRKQLADSEAISSKLKSEMKVQVKEIWRLQQSAQLSSDLEHQVHHQQSELHDLRRQLDTAMAEKDIIVRQNAFLQREADKLVTENTKMVTNERARFHRSAVKGETSFGASFNTTIRESLLERSKLFESLQFDEAHDDERDRLKHSPLPNQVDTCEVSSASQSPVASPLLEK